MIGIVTIERSGAEDRPRRVAGRAELDFMVLPQVQWLGEWSPARS